MRSFAEYFCLLSQCTLFVSVANHIPPATFASLYPEIVVWYGSTLSQILFV